MTRRASPTLAGARANRPASSFRTPGRYHEAGRFSWVSGPIARRCHFHHREPTTPLELEFDYDDKIAPRIGMVWDINQEGEWKAFANWGLYFDQTKLALPSLFYSEVDFNLSWYTLDTADFRSLGQTDCPPDCSGTLIFGPLDLGTVPINAETNPFDPDAEPMRLQEWSLGVEHLLTPRLTVGLRYLHKQIDRALEDIGAVDAQGNEITVIGNPGHGLATVAHVFPDGSTVSYPEAVRDYDALELTVERRRANRWSGRFSYSYSRLEGNYSGLSDSEFLSPGTPNTNVHFDHPFTMFDESGRPNYGRLPMDRPTRRRRSSPTISTLVPPWAYIGPERAGAPSPARPTSSPAPSRCPFSTRGEGVTVG